MILPRVPFLRRLRLVPVSVVVQMLDSIFRYYSSRNNSRKSQELSEMKKIQLAKMTDTKRKDNKL
ncbi:hypothetical protein BYT27DRAFT_7187535 [Phlegmacium glaucopus]|nr:hypothetical protein BYT27DRAFT_7187488 [Phlegmacium glaucopus]KAF8809680.1 hypothetical protein BYT27DRAFT_7187535 [Phlegmacium glaucopus]